MSDTSKQASRQRIAIVTGANRGLGFETCRQLGRQGYRIILAARDAVKGAAAAATLKKEEIDAEFRALDVSKDESVAAFCRWVETELGRVDVLVNNAGVFLDAGRGKEGDPERSSAFRVDVSVLRETMETNVYGHYQLCQKLIPLMIKNGYGRVVNLSSGMGQLSEMNGGYPGYRLSKTAMNVLTRVFADETAGMPVLINSVCPGWVKTDMGGEGAELSVQEGVDTIVWLATLPPEGPTGGFFRGRRPLDW